MEHSVDVIEKMQILLSYWEMLGGITRLTFSAESKSKVESGWNGTGKGDVVATSISCNVLIFKEKGTWQSKQGIETGFSNTFRWTLDKQACVISLEHLRRGPDHPVFLFNLAPSSKYTLVSVDSHLCKKDAYFGHIQLDGYGFRFNWRVIGPKKNEEIDYYYS